MPGNMQGDTTEYLTSLEAVRRQSHLVLEMGKRGKLGHFDLDMSRLPSVMFMIIRLIERDYGPVDVAHVVDTIQKIPPHGRWRHFGDENINGLLRKLEIEHGKANTDGIVMAMLDLFVVAVLLDAGAGDAWKFRDPLTGKEYGRSEGLAVASLRMFELGKFSSRRAKEADSIGLKNLREEDIEEGFQVTKKNPLLGVTGRLDLLHRLGGILETRLVFCPKDHRGLSRPGSVLIYIQQNQQGTGSVAIDVLWKWVIQGFGGVWRESRTNINGMSLGDAWPCDAMGGAVIPFHKLSQWLAYSLIEPLERIAGIKFDGVNKMTGLAEYRNGGLFVDMGIIKLRASAMMEGMRVAASSGNSEPTFDPGNQVIVEWRALTVALIDHLANLLRGHLSVSEDQLPLSKILEAGTWKAGREIAQELRPSSHGPPIITMSDGTLF